MAKKSRKIKLCEIQAAAIDFLKICRSTISPWLRSRAAD
jgi:hypothetical protein